MSSETINFGQIFAVAVVGFLLYRWFSGPTPASSSQFPGGNGSRQINPDHVEQVVQMFPQLDRRAIMWDLQRNGGSVQATIERVLSGRSLDSPPPSFQPQIPRPAAPPATRSAAPNVKTNPDLITRYDLGSRINNQTRVDDDTQSQSTGSKIQGWSQNKTERSEILKRRREEMVLAARRKMEERDRSAA